MARLVRKPDADLRIDAGRLERHREAALDSSARGIAGEPHRKGLARLAHQFLFATLAICRVQTVLGIGQSHQQAVGFIFLQPGEIDLRL